MRKLFCVVLINLSLVALPVHAAGDSSNDSSVERLFAIMGTDKQMNAGFEAMLPLVDQQATQMNLGPAARQELRKIYSDWFHQDFDRDGLKKKIIDVYTDTFSRAEIQQLITFYQSPVGQKFITELPRLSKIGAQLGMEEGRAKQHLLQQRLQPFLDVHAR
jgi:hypothetical protein